jgi:hypothetical protein
MSRYTRFIKLKHLIFLNGGSILCYNLVFYVPVFSTHTILHATVYCILSNGSLWACIKRGNFKAVSISTLLCCSQLSIFLHSIMSLISSWWRISLDQYEDYSHRFSLYRLLSCRWRRNPLSMRNNILDHVLLQNEASTRRSNMEKMKVSE